MRLALPVIVLLIPLPAMAQSALPPCPQDSAVAWTNCVGSLLATDGDRHIYVGEFRDSLPHGKGTWTFADGGTYVGEFKDGLFNGEGTYTYPDGHFFIGTFKAGERSGQGKLISVGGYRLAEGAWTGHLVVSHADTNWHWVGKSGSDFIFVAPKTIRKGQKTRRAWTMFALTAPRTEKKILSTRMLVEVDCAEERFRSLSSSNFSGSFGSGELLGSFAEEPWEYAAPGTVPLGLTQYICAYQVNP